MSLAALWALAFVIEKSTGSAGPSFFILLLAVVVHGTATLGLRGIATFFVVTMLVSFLLEALSIATGFPFGLFVHHMAMPRPLGVPLIVPPSYAVHGYLGWRVACAILRCEDAGPSALRLLGAPLLAAFVIPGFDLVVDPMGATVAHTWSYAHPSGYFGVPLSNFLGWIVTSWTMIQAYALVEALVLRAERRAHPSTALRLVPALAWALIGLQFAIDLLRGPGGMANVAGRNFLVADIAEASLIAGLFAMVPPALAAATAILSTQDRALRR
ncbi:carotenoid biosynthesis protein [Novosphingobium sp. KCTC 2891]|nr:carotenoid biosynthesis protein [Novosphingobium sp. KCTC 2891]